MKMAILLPFFAALLITACQPADEKKAEAVQVKSAATAPVDPAAQKREALLKAPSLGADQLTAFLPEALNGAKRSNFSMSSNLGYAVAHADYIRNSRTEIRVNVYDCSGEAGAGLYESNYSSKLDKDEKKGEDYTRTIQLDGRKAIESYNKAANATTYTFLNGEQVLIMVAGRNVPADALKDAVQKINGKP